MSKNFELMRQAGKGIGQRKGSRIAVDTDENPVTQLATGSPVLDDNKAFDWTHTLGILQKHWRLSALFCRRRHVDGHRHQCVYSASV